MQQNNLKREALEYHARERRGKVEVVPTKPYSTQRDLSLAYSPGVAEPCMAIAEEPQDVYKYTAKGNWSRSSATAPRCWGWATSGRRRASL